MKRSEMIDYIVINGKEGYPSLGYFPRDVVDKVLRLAEKAGMLPPNALVWTVQEVHYNIDTDETIEKGDYAYRNAWEPESDEDSIN